MVGFVFGAFGALIRLIFVYKGDTTKMGDAYNTNPVVEGGKNRLYGFITLTPIAG